MYTSFMIFAAIFSDKNGVFWVRTCRKPLPKTVQNKTIYILHKRN